MAVAESNNDIMWRRCMSIPVPGTQMGEGLEVTQEVLNFPPQRVIVYLLELDLLSSLEYYQYMVTPVLLR